MSILVDTHIKEAIANGDIVIDPYRPECVGCNSVDVHLGSWLAVADELVLDCKKKNRFFELKIPDEGLVLQPGTLYLASTLEYTETHKHIPFLEGKSSLGRLGIACHITAGRGDVGYKGFWTLEIAVIHPVRVYAGMPIGQLIYHTPSGAPEISYSEKADAKYNNERGESKPIASQFQKNFNKETNQWK